MEIRLIRPAEWRELKELRLRALGVAPDSFGSTLAAEQAEPDEEWQAWAADGARGREQSIFVAAEDERLHGMANGSFISEDAEIADLFAVWVDAEHRRTGIGRGLVDAAVVWAEARGASRVHVRVTDSNEAARLLYERTGFVSNGVREPLRPGSPLQKVTMERPL